MLMPKRYGYVLGSLTLNGAFVGNVIRPMKFADVPDLDFVGRLVVQHGCERSAEHLVSRIVFITGRVEDRLVVLDRVPLGQDGFTRPPEADLVVVVEVVVEPHERVGPRELRR